MLVFYRGPRALITQQFFEAEQLGRLQFAVKELTEVHVVQLEPEGGPADRLFGLSPLLAALLVVPIVGPGSKLAVGVAAGVVVIGSVMNARRRSPAGWCLVATCHQQTVTLFDSADQTEFGQVSRGLRRALEYSREHP